MATRKSINKMWKAFEATVAKEFGSERTPLSGENSRHDTHSDSLHPRIYIEAKRDQRLVGKTFSDLIDDTWCKALDEDKIPMIAFKIQGTRGYMIVCHSEDLKDLAEEKL